MHIVEQSFEIIDELDADKILKKIEKCGRICYNSYSKMKDGSDRKFIATLIKAHHESVLEHFAFTVHFVTDRGCSHEIVRHRLCSFSQQSQRYVKYDDVGFIAPTTIEKDSPEWQTWLDSCQVAEQNYKSLREQGLKPEQARAVLPNSTATEIMVTANIREWRWVLRQRTDRAAHPDIRALMIPLLKELQKQLPVLFDDIEVE